MKKVTLIVVCAMAALFFASCQTGKREDKNNDTPSSVVDKMYKAIQNNDFAEAAKYNRIPDTIKMDETHVYEEFKNNKKADGKVVITKEEWQNFVIEKMKNQSAGFTLDSWEIVSEEISNTDPNSAKVNTKIHITRTDKDGNAVKSEAECSFPLKRENDVWLIIG